MSTFVSQFCYLSIYYCEDHSLYQCEFDKKFLTKIILRITRAFMDCTGRRRGIRQCLCWQPTILIINYLLLFSWVRVLILSLFKLLQILEPAGVKLNAGDIQIYKEKQVNINFIVADKVADKLNELTYKGHIYLVLIT